MQNESMPGARKASLLVTLANEGYVDAAKQLFSSAHFNGLWQGDMLLLADGMSAENLEWFKSRGILIYECEPVQAKFSTIGKWPPVVLDKFYLFTDFFKHWKTVLFLDADIIVRAPLDAFAHVDRLSAPIAHARLAKSFKRRLELFARGLDAGPYRQARELFDFDKPEFSSGTFAFPTDMIGRSTFDDIVRIQNEYGEITAFVDQTALNLAFQDWSIMPATYGLFPDKLMLNGCPSGDIDAVILHFVMSKPWEKGNPFHAEWLGNLHRADSMDARKPVQARVGQPDRDRTLNGLIAKADALNARYRISFRSVMLRLKQELDWARGIVGMTLTRLGILPHNPYTRP